LPPVMENIEAIARLEHEFLGDRNLADRIGDTVGAFVGTMTFVIIHVVWFTTWLLINSGMIPGVGPFDPFPFILLSVMVSVEGVLLTTFVLMKQNRMSKRAEQRNQLNLQIDMLSEREITKMLQMLTSVCDHMGLRHHAAEEEVQQLSQHTAVDMLAEELRKKMPD
jgi:uncharacterized membrane protein